MNQPPQFPSPYGPQPPQGQTPPPTLPQPGYPQLGQSASQMEKSSKPWIWIILIIIFISTTLVAAGFAISYSGQAADYKNNVDAKIATAVEAARKETEKAKEEEFLERSKNPYKKYTGPSTFGSVEITYPKTWSATINESTSNPPVNGYFHPDWVPGIKTDTAFALRLEVLEQPYDKVLGNYESNAKKGLVRISPYKAKRVPSVLGAKVDGEIEKEKQGSAVLFPLRDKTIRVSTLSSGSFGKDFNNIILPNLLFIP